MDEIRSQEFDLIGPLKFVNSFQKEFEWPGGFPEREKTLLELTDALDVKVIYH